MLGLKRPARADPPRSVWGLAVHSLSGTPFFDSGGNHISDYIYSIKQGNGLPDDYYLCDSRTHPQGCALIGGNLRHACAEWYNPEQCQFCEDLGSAIRCEVRGFNNKYDEWVKVPIYPRDMVGEMYRGEGADVMARPLWASVTIPKWELRRPVKEMPYYMVTDYEVKDLIKLWEFGPTPPPHAAKAFAMESSMPDANLMALGIERMSSAASRQESAPAQGKPEVPKRTQDF